MPNIAKTFYRFLRSRCGNTSIMFALAAVPALGAAGSAIDYARYRSAETELAAAMDAAVLTGAQTLSEKSGDEAAAKSAASLFLTNAIQDRTDVVGEVATFTVTADKTGMTGKVTAQVNTSLLQLVGVSSIPLSVEASSAVAKGNPAGDLEVSLMLDVTGSMCNDKTGPCSTGSKISALKTAAKTLIDTVVWDDQSTFTSRVALVPFSTRVRVGADGSNPSLMTQLTNMPVTWSGWYKQCTAGSGSGGSEGNGNWSCSSYQSQKKSNWKIMPCVTERFYNSTWSFDLTDAAPGSGAWFNGHDGSRMVLGWDSTNTAPTSEKGTKSSDPTANWNYEPNGTCYDVPQSAQIMPLTSDKTALKARVDGLQAYGATNGVLGTEFTWYMLSPNWKNIWTGSSTPKDYSLLTQTNDTGGKKLRKVAVLMTDGAYNAYRGWKEQDVNFISANAKAMCQAMKDKGIEIYTVGFDLDSLSASEKAVATDVLKSCGSSVEHFYLSINAAQLQAAFESIGKKVSGYSVRLTK